MLTLADLSVIIPVGLGDDTWQALLPDLVSLPTAAEIFLAGSENSAAPDNLHAHISQLKCRAHWLQSQNGRAIQQNSGAAAARNQVLWFLHSDSRLSTTTLPMLEKTLLQLPGKLGYFDLAFAADGPFLMRLNACGANWRSRTFGLPFGDQGIFLMRSDFIALGQFNPAIKYGEDHELVWRARRNGIRCLRVNATITTSARKYVEQGWWRTTRKHLWATWKQAWVFSEHRNSR